MTERKTVLANGRDVMRVRVDDSTYNHCIIRIEHMRLSVFPKTLWFYRLSEDPHELLTGINELIDEFAPERRSECMELQEFTGGNLPFSTYEALIGGWGNSWFWILAGTAEEVSKRCLSVDSIYPYFKQKFQPSFGVLMRIPP